MTLSLGAGWATVLAGPSLAAGDESLAERLTRKFEDSAITFPRSGSNAPFLPLAFLGAKYYSEAEIEDPELDDVNYDVSTVSQAAGLPLVLGERDALVIGEYLSWSTFSLEGGYEESFDVTTVGLPLAWLRQLNSQWQTIAFVMPMGRDSNQPGADWTWQYLAGAFGRYDQTDRLWWAYGFYADIGPDEDFFIPYIGASWTIDERWTLSAVMPWPAVVYAPDRDWFVRLGVSPSGASWSIDPAGGRTSVNLDAWDFGLGAERRLGGNLWLSLEAGVGGFRGLRISGSGTDVEAPEIDISVSPYVGIELNFRPGVD